MICKYFLLYFVVSFAVKTFSLRYSHLLIFVFVVCSFTVMCKKLMPRAMSRRFLPMFSSRGFTLSGLMFKSLIYFKLTSVSSVKQGSSSNLLHVIIQFHQHHLLKIVSFLHWVSFLPCLILVDHICMSISGLLILICWSICLFSCQYHSVLIIIVL